MKLTTLMDVYACLKGEGEEIFLDGETVRKAKRSLDNMLAYGG